MNLENIISISGFPGLYTVVGQTGNGIVVESIETGKRMPAYSSHKVSALDDISIFTETEDIPLKEVFQKIYDVTKGKKELEGKPTSEELKAFLEKALPNYDRDRVYTSDIKKLVKWYNTLLDAKLLVPEKKETKSKEKTSEKEDKKPKKAAAKKNTKGSTTKAKSTAKKAPKKQEAK